MSRMYIRTGDWHVTDSLIFILISIPAPTCDHAVRTEYYRNGRSIILYLYTFNIVYITYIFFALKFILSHICMYVHI